MRGWVAPVVVVLLATAGGLAFSQLYLRPAPPSAQLAVEQRLLCPQCQEVRLDVCDRPICTDMKADIARRLAAGQSQDAIVSAYRQAYGPAILADNQPGGQAAWLFPWALVLLAVAALAVLGWRFRGVSRAELRMAADRGLEAELAAWRSGH
ncbi:MAG TPA: cytochrome c-type biogenesis protein CcmH [Candidatus Dormibacteraeota bacterium]|nr:cytochrome c-type biogenesis protein CcmH [Candidatus Dormibacteraeota bacterium]